MKYNNEKISMYNIQLPLNKILVIIPNKLIKKKIDDLIKFSLSSLYFDPDTQLFSYKNEIIFEELKKYEVYLIQKNFKMMIFLKDMLKIKIIK